MDLLSPFDALKKSALVKALSDPQTRTDLANNARSAMSGAMRGVTTDILGAPSDLLSMFKYNTLMGGEPTYVPGNSEQLGNIAENAGILPPRENNVSYKAGEFLGPIALAGVPKAVNTGKDILATALQDLPMSPSRAQYGAITYHGSPYQFDKFDLSKVGTGEGAQAYGHGIYVAENPGVAGDYKYNLTRQLPDRVKLDGETIQEDSIFRRALEDVGFLGKDRAMQNLDDNIRFNKTYAPDIAELYKAAKARLSEIEPSRISVNNGSLYHVDVPDEHIANMLDWDGILDEQPQAVKDYAALFGIKPKNGADLTGRDIYKAAVERMGGSQEQASASLRNFGVPGTKYFDASSRGTATVEGGGTRNFVLFDPSIAKIVKRE